MIKNKRTVEIFKNNKWIPISFHKLKNGDTFKMYEPNGEVVKNLEGRTVFIAISCKGGVCNCR